MRKIALFVVALILLTSFVLAEGNTVKIQELKPLYNLGEKINLQITLTTVTGIYDYLALSLICNGEERKLPEKEVFLETGGIKIEKQIFLIEKFIGLSKGTCIIRASLQEEPEVYAVTKEFEISDLLNVKLSSEEREFAPGQIISARGEVTKQNGELVNGFIDLMTISDTLQNVTYSDLIKNGFFQIDFAFPEQIKAGQYLISLNAYETDPLGGTTNKGFLNYNILIKQVPTSLEIAFENSNTEIEPGTNLQVKTILHDQTGEKIPANSVIIIKNNASTVVERIEKQTEELLEFPIKSNEPPGEWTVNASSSGLQSEAFFRIKEKEAILTELINRTVSITNIGNVPYNKTVLVKIGNESVNINVSLTVGESKEYLLTAPDGEYQVEVITEDGETALSEITQLTGRAIGIKEASTGIIDIIRHPFVWIFITVVLGFVAFIIFKKGYKKSFFGRIHSFPLLRKKKLESPENYHAEKIIKKDKLIETKNHAELSLSIKGEKQNSSIICLRLNNFDEISLKKSDIKGTFQKIAWLCEENKAFIYENNNHIFFIFAPVKTRTFRNEPTALNMAQKIKEIMSEHNRLFRNKIEFGIALNEGTIIAGDDKNILRFMSMGTLITGAKKIASFSNQEILFSEEINRKLKPHARTEKHSSSSDGDAVFYTLKEIKDTEEYKRFLRSFLKRIEGKD